MGRPVRPYPFARTPGDTISTLRTPALVALLTVTTLITLSGCGASETIEPAAERAGSSEGTTDYPVVISNCGYEQIIEAAPQRVVSLDQNSTEILLSLGVSDSLVGTASWTDPVLDSLADANASVPRLSDNAPTYEVLLGTDPDFVTASFGRHYASAGVAGRDRLAETGIGSYLSPTDCDNGESVNGGGTRTTALAVDALYQEIRELAEIFDVQARGEALVTELQGRAAAASEGLDFDGRTVMFWFADTKTPYIAGGLGSAALLASTTNMTNVFADTADDWPAVGWETVVDADPDILVLGDLQRDRFPGDRLDEKIQFLETDPLTQDLEVVQQQHYISLHGAEMNPSIRFVDGLEKIRAWWDDNKDAL